MRLSERRSNRTSSRRYAVLSGICLLLLPACNHLEARFVEEEHPEAAHRVVVTSPVSRDVVSSQQYVAQIHSCRHIEVRALETGYLQEIPVAEGQTVEEGHLLFRILPTLYRAKLEAESAEAQLAKIELANTQRLASQNVVSQQEVALAQAKVAKAEAQVELALAEFNFATLKAPFNIRDPYGFEDVIEMLRETAGQIAAFPVSLKVGTLSGFLALLPDNGEGRLSALADAVLEAFDPFWARLDGADFARRAAGLNTAQMRLLERWGYPHVKDHFRFHMTLTDRLSQEEAERVTPLAQAHFDPILATPVRIDRLALFVEAEPGADFLIHQSLPLTGRADAPKAATTMEKAP